jgi:hypothetical protein
MLAPVRWILGPAIALRFPTVRTVVVYSAIGSPQRLELVGEAQSFHK